MRILIADDETPIREWIQFSIERGKNPEFEIVGVAENGNEAYELALSCQADIVITDIRMPGLDGIELMKRVLEVRPYTAFIILTNYAEFSYAREAVTYGARKYLLKSELRGRDILEALEEIRKDWKKKEEHKVQDLYSNGYLDVFNCYYNLENDEFLREFWTRNGFSEEMYYIVAALEKQEGEGQKEVLDGFVRSGGVHAIGPALKNKSIYLILQADREEQLWEEAEQLSEILRQAGQGLMVSGRVRRGRKELMAALDEAEQMLRYAFLLSEGHLRISDAREVAPLDRQEIRKEGKKLLAGLLYDPEETVRQNLDQWFHSLHGASFQDIQWVREMCVWLVARLEEVCGEHIPGFLEEQRIEGDWNLEQYRQLCTELTGRLYRDDHFRYSQTVREAIRYIQQNYQKDISLNDVAGYIYRSPEYLSRLFKTETGEKFSTYLMTYRLKIARKLLLETDMKVYEVAYAVGYTTPSYFSKIYREYTGVAPEVTRSQRNVSK